VCGGQSFHRNRRVGKANGSRECAPDGKLRAPTIQDSDPAIDGGHGADAPLPTLRLNHFPFTILRQCCHAASIRFSLASGVRNAECADSVTLGNFVSG
jgi:hypothetical protein